MNECNSTSHSCVSEKEGGQCINTGGTHTCSCKVGYHGNGIKTSVALSGVLGNGCQGQSQEKIT